jgi:hypothetical protein
MTRRLATGKDAVRRAVRELGVDEVVAAEAVHEAKEATGMGPADNIAIDLDTGDILVPETAEVIGNIRGE